MKVIILLSLMAVAMGYKYPPENENFDVQSLSDIAVLRKFSGCFLDRNPCDVIAERFKRKTCYFIMIFTYMKHT
jgi:hypothetical protein